MRSAYSHGHEFDVFISYSSRDLAWVKRFHDDLVADANRHARHDIVVFFDKSRLEPGFVWEDRLVSAARGAAIMLPVLSARFFDSEYCQKEINAFIEAHGATPGRSHQSRVMPVNLLCAAPSSHVLNGFQATTFFTQGGDGVPYEHEPDTPLYREAVRKIAFAIAQVLNGLVPAQTRSTVYVASDFKAPSEKLRASLSHHYAVVPERPSDLMGLTPTELDQSLQLDFDRSFASVHVMSDATFAQPLIERQLDYARLRKNPRLVWSAERPDHLTSEGFE
jgi:hypothetical protein